MARKRDRLEIVYTILRTIRDSKNSIRYTPLLRKTNISSQSFGQYYDELQSKGLIREIRSDPRTRYVTLTDAGFEFLETFGSIMSFIEDFDL